MNISFYSAATGMISQQHGLDVYADNIANINTVGHKALRPAFAECLYTHQKPAQEDFETGHGQYPLKTDFMWQQGQVVETERDLDFALPNDGFFMVKDRNDNNFLTRNGQFGMTEVDGEWQLVNNSGEFVLDYEGNRIAIPFAAINENRKMADGFDIEDIENGNLTVRVDYNALTELIGVYTVPNNYGLEQANTNHLVITERSGAAEPAPDLDKLHKFLEHSTVDLATDMVHLIETQRSYQLNAKVVQTSDELMRIANTLRG